MRSSQHLLHVFWNLLNISESDNLIHFANLSTHGTVLRKDYRNRKCDKSRKYGYLHEKIFEFTDENKTILHTNHICKRDFLSKRIFFEKTQILHTGCKQNETNWTVVPTNFIDNQVCAVLTTAADFDA